jgi:alpha-glucosidase
VRQQAGLFSREGWAIVDDSKTAVVLNSTWHDRWSQRGRRSGAMDTYFFGWGSDFKGGMKEFTRLAGRIPIMPWRAHGVWWSRYWPYNETGIKDVVENYESHALPLNMLVMDVDWHDRPGSTSIDIGCFWDTTPPNGAALHEQCANGYGGYNWNTSLFPSPTSFQQWVHEERSLQLMLNLHSQCGIDKCQHKYAEVLQANGMPSPSTGWNQTIQCAITDPNYVKTLYEFVLDDGDNAGVDFWWEDYGVDFHSTKENSSDPLSTHVDRCDEPNVGGHCTRCLADPVEDQPALWSAYVRVQAEEAKGKRGMTLGIYGGLGHHRYPLVGSGDTYESYDTLSYEVYLSISSANVGVAWTRKSRLNETRIAQVSHYEGACLGQLAHLTRLSWMPKMI